MSEIRKALFDGISGAFRDWWSLATFAPRLFALLFRAAKDRKKLIE